MFASTELPGQMGEFKALLNTSMWKKLFGEWLFEKLILAATMCWLGENLTREQICK